MRKTIFAMAALGLLLATACKKTESKNNNNGSAGGTWTFKSVTYQAPGCDTLAASVTIAINATVPIGGTPTTGGELGVDFYSSYPSAAGSFTVINGIRTLANASQVQLGITDLNGVKYNSTGVGNSTVAVTVTGGKISITGTGIQLVNQNNAADTSNLTFTIHQTN